MAARPRAVDATLATGIFVLSLLAVPATPETVGLTQPPLTAVTVGLLAVACLALMWRRSSPLIAWAVALGATLVPFPAGTVGRGLPAAIAALYAVATYGSRRAAVVTTAATMAGVIVLLSRSVLVDAQDPLVYAVVGWCALAAALGDAVRSNRAILAAALQRARRAEDDRDEEAARRVAEERLRISRELHDVVAHHVAVVNVQAGVAEHLASSDPPAALEALSRVRSAARMALQEMGAIVGLLRANAGPDERDDAVVLPPAPGAQAIPALVGSMRASGVDVTWSHEGPTLGGTPGDDLHLYRVIQEALTNAARHGTGHIALRTRQASDHTTVEVQNALGAAGAPVTTAGGHGLVGMRERMAVVGGDLYAGAADGSFLVRARFPVQEPT
ncbi:MAG: two-component sensor histidine kinase [Actinomycetales bacterium]|nr:two-component sensor histidine kinase [Actinomycetales bacterium]